MKLSRTAIQILLSAFFVLSIPLQAVQPAVAAGGDGPYARQPGPAITGAGDLAAADLSAATWTLSGGVQDSSFEAFDPHGRHPNVDDPFWVESSKQFGTPPVTIGV